jgi:hypothetical protein
MSNTEHKRTYSERKHNYYISIHLTSFAAMKILFYLSNSQAINNNNNHHHPNNTEQ